MTDFRITKYNPIFRGPNGAYLKNEWAGFEEIGRKFPDGKLKLREYLETEDKYVKSAFLIMEAANVTELIVRDLEPGLKVFNRLRKKLPKYVFRDADKVKYSLTEGAVVSGSDISWVIRLCLRHECWCRLEGKGKFFIHFGYDYYMSAGGDLLGDIDCDFPSGIYVEEFISPHHREVDDG